jgi:DNA-binding MarR family transcriptional regulator
MTDATDARRTRNLIGAFAVAATDRIQAATSAGTGLAGTDVAALLLLTTTLEGVTQDALAPSLGVTESGAARLVDRLVAAGFVRRDPGRNRRSVSIAVTPAGRAAAHKGLTAREQTCDDLLAVLTVGERGTLTHLLEKLLRPMPVSLPSAHRICRLCDPIACGHDENRCPVTLGVPTPGDAPPNPQRTT